MKRAVAFLHGVYRRRDLPFFIELCKGRTTLAVDGGYSFFRKAGIVPDVLIGDFDSLRRMPRSLPDTTTVLRFPAQKDKTDAHLAIDYCLEQGATEIDMVMPECGDMDHALGSILLLGLADLTTARLSRPMIRVVSRSYEVRLVADGKTVFSHCAGDVVSVLPLSDRIVLTCRGTEYDVDGAKLRFGDSRGLRNRIVRARAVMGIMGKALVVHQFIKGRQADV